MEMFPQSGKPPSGLEHTGTALLSNHTWGRFGINPVVSGLGKAEWEFWIMLIEEAFPIPLLFSYLAVTVLQSYPLEFFPIHLGNSLKICCWMLFWTTFLLDLLCFYSSSIYWLIVNLHVNPSKSSWNGSDCTTCCSCRAAEILLHFISISFWLTAYSTTTQSGAES